MKQLAICLVAAVVLSACGNSTNNNGHSTPIDSTNVQGTSPATYGPDDPNRDTISVNANDTGTDANTASRPGSH